jgi:hypothetical protein
MSSDDDSVQFLEYHPSGTYNPAHVLSPPLLKVEDEDFSDLDKAKSFGKNAALADSGKFGNGLSGQASSSGKNNDQSE